ncbi:tumor necrosis factor ligand superfamily member 18 isoform X2 [Electrophorus electricus]|uniref:tumor necrosis factor ligand superfamily member 18 isoform X2 n=1 Tax=Electrophorus electricus TaxID=8005 RepID=UPI0015D08F4B|nr:tumor necrosis factor ligand superfamily member 18 isoform X2 [Electrophorus electricus]
MEGQVCYNQDGCGARVAQLRRLVWVLLAWASLLTAALVVSISLQFFYPRAFSLTEPASGPVLSPAPLKRTSLHLFDYSSWDNNSGMLVWQKFPEGTNVHVTCKPATQFSKQDTYLGMIKL